MAAEAATAAVGSDLGICGEMLKGISESLLDANGTLYGVFEYLRELIGNNMEVVALLNIGAVVCATIAVVFGGIFLLIFSAGWLGLFCQVVIFTFCYFKIGRRPDDSVGHAPSESADEYEAMRTAHSEEAKKVH